MNLQRKCPDCGSPLPPDAPEGICPECLMKRGLSFSQDTNVSVEPIETSEGRDLPNTGDQFGEYRVLRELGRGGMGAVYEAEQIETGRRKARLPYRYLCTPASSWKTQKPWPTRNPRGIH